jgi:putative glutamine amidotransferase
VISPVANKPLSPKPIVLVPACNHMLGEHPFYIVGKKYLDAVRLAGCTPLVVPAADPSELAALLDLADGVLLTGSPSNVHPSHFGEAVHNPALPLDPDRDDWTLPLIPRVLERGIPLFAICRGFQETNVALGGSLHQAVHEVAGQHDHRGAGASGGNAEAAYGIAHHVMVERGGTLDAILDQAEIDVNSVHGQGVNRLAEGLRVEARAPDGLVEAFSKPGSAGFNLCVQWHPEWKAAENPISVKLFKAFGHACERFRSRRLAAVSEPDR